MNAPIRVSASAIKNLTHCSLSFYYGRVLKVVEKTWPRTVVGSCVHAVLESLANPRHRRHFDLITAPGTRVDYTLSPAVARLVRGWKVRHSISDELMADLNGMLYVGLLLIDFYFTKAVKVYPPEYEFNLDLGDGMMVRGFIDQLADMGEYILLRDFKSQRARFTEKELAESIQAFVYQMVCLELFGKPARVEFVMLRHPPTKRTPMKHLQIVEPSTTSQLAGLREYLRSMGKVMNDFTLEEGMRSPCTDVGFCERVCSFYAPSDYYALVLKSDPTQAPLKTFPLDKPPAQWDMERETLVKKRHEGCLAKWRQPEAG